jgi:hypothetical protein
LAPPAASQLKQRLGAFPSAMVIGAPPLSTWTPFLSAIDHEI